MYSKDDKNWISSFKFMKEHPEKNTFSLDWYKTHYLTLELEKQDIFLNNYKVLDLGCGLGSRSFILSEKYTCDFHGLDSSNIAIEYAKTNFQKENLKFYHGDALNTNFSQYCFNTIFMIEVVEHIQNLDKLKYELLRILKPNGYLFITVPDGSEHGDPDHVHKFKSNNIESIFKNIVEIKKLYVKNGNIFMLGIKNE